MKYLHSLCADAIRPSPAATFIVSGFNDQVYSL